MYIKKLIKMFHLGTKILLNGLKTLANNAKLKEKTQGFGKTENSLCRKYVQFASLV